MNPLFRIDFSISDSLKIVRKSVLIYETIIQRDRTAREAMYALINSDKNKIENVFSKLI